MAGLVVAGVSLPTVARSADVTAVVTQEVRPVLVRNLHNRLFKLTVTCQQPYVVVNGLTVSLSGTDDRKDIDVIEVFVAVDIAGRVGLPTSHRVLVFSFLSQKVGPIAPSKL